MASIVGLNWVAGIAVGLNWLAGIAGGLNWVEGIAVVVVLGLNWVASTCTAGGKLDWGSGVVAVQPVVAGDDDDAVGFEGALPLRSQVPASNCSLHQLICPPT